jgi:hypothetical protein
VTKEEVFLQHLFSPEWDIIQSPKRNEEAYEAYKRAGMLCVWLFMQGKLSDIRIDNPDTPYSMHRIELRWKGDEDGFAESETNSLVSILSEMETICMEAKEPLVWYLDTTIYTEV